MGNDLAEVTAQNQTTYLGAFNESRFFAQKRSAVRLARPRIDPWRSALAALSRPHSQVDEIFNAVEQSASGDEAARTLEVAVGESQRLLGWEQDWDGMGAEGYDKATLDRAISFTRGAVRWLTEHHRRSVPAPRFGPGPSGSIDIHWKTERHEILINIPKGDGPAEFYGDDYGTESIKGKFDPARRNLLVMTWLSAL
jgi:hypothetical protein